jgi:hypothetical protein
LLQQAWREAEEARAGAALGLGPLTGLFDRHFPLLYDIEEARPRDVNDAGWDVAMRGLRTFLATGGADEALRLDWPHGELFGVPPLWARVDLCGAAPMIGESEVVEVTPTRIEIKTASGAVQARSHDFTVVACRNHHGCGLEVAKKMVMAAMKRSGAP